MHFVLQYIRHPLLHLIQFPSTPHAFPHFLSFLLFLALLTSSLPRSLARLRYSIEQLDGGGTRYKIKIANSFREAAVLTYHSEDNITFKSCLNNQLTVCNFVTVLDGSILSATKLDDENSAEYRVLLDAVNRSGEGSVP